MIVAYSVIEHSSLIVVDVSAADAANKYVVNPIHYMYVFYFDKLHFLLSYKEL